MGPVQTSTLSVTVAQCIAAPVGGQRQAADRLRCQSDHDLSGRSGLQVSKVYGRPTVIEIRKEASTRIPFDVRYGCRARQFRRGQRAAVH